jgi:hypothetical protein
MDPKADMDAIIGLHSPASEWQPIRNVIHQGKPKQTPESTCFVPLRMPCDVLQAFPASSQDLGQRPFVALPNIYVMVLLVDGPFESKPRGGGRACEGDLATQRVWPTKRR